MCFEEGCQAAASDLFFPFDYKSDIARQFCTRFQISFYRFEVREVLPFIIASATREQRSILDPRLKRRRFPKLKRLRRLHIVMAIDHEMCPPGSASIPAGESRRLRLHNRVPPPWAEPCLQTYLLAMSHH